MKDNGCKLAKERSRSNSAQTTDSDYADVIELLANILAQTEFLLNNLERVAADIGLHDNADKAKYTCLIKEATSPH